MSYEVEPGGTVDVEAVLNHNETTASINDFGAGWMNTKKPDFELVVPQAVTDAGVTTSELATEGVFSPATISRSGWKREMTWNAKTTFTVPANYLDFEHPNPIEGQIVASKKPEPGAGMTVKSRATVKAIHPFNINVFKSWTGNILASRHARVLGYTDWQNEQWNLSGVLDEYWPTLYDNISNSAGAFTTSLNIYTQSVARHRYSDFQNTWSALLRHRWVLYTINPTINWKAIKINVEYQGGVSPVNTKLLFTKYGGSYTYRQRRDDDPLAESHNVSSGENYIVMNKEWESGLTYIACHFGTDMEWAPVSMEAHNETESGFRLYPAAVEVRLY